MKLGEVIKKKVVLKDDQNLIFQTAGPKEDGNHENWPLKKIKKYKGAILNGCLKLRIISVTFMNIKIRMLF